jgi:dienelactone hydrolase
MIFHANPLPCLLLICLSVLSSCAQHVSFYSDADHPKYNATVTGGIYKPGGDGPFPAVVLMHGCGGLTKEVKAGMIMHSGHLVSNGFVALILDSFTGRGKGGEAACLGHQGAAFQYRQYDAFHALKYLQSQPFVDKNNIFLMGQSQGGGVALSIARFGADDYVFPDKPIFQGVVAFYPLCDFISDLLPVELVSPLLVLAGRKDNWTPPYGCVLAKENVSGADYEVIVYDHAHHSFDLNIRIQTFANHTVGGNVAARKDSQKQMLSWFLSHMQK